MPPPPLPRAFLRPIAHRGWHDAAHGRTENAGPAFAAAITAGYGIECDLRPLACGTPVVFHDETLERLVEAPPGRRVDQLTLGEFAALRYRPCGTPLMTFEALLRHVAGVVPLLVEIKSEWTPLDERFLSTIARLATTYPGPLALMSFDPAPVARMSELAPAVPRGLVSGSYRRDTADDWWTDQLPPARAAALRDLADFPSTRSCFAAYEVAALGNAAAAALRTSGIPLLTWTVRTPQDRAKAQRHADAMIFEGFTP